jgi:glycosyltransferase 2 family protein
MTMKRLRTYLLFGTKAVVSLALLYVALRFVNFSVLRERFYRLDYVWLAAALLTFAFEFVLTSLRWELIADACGARITFRQSLLYNFIGSFFSQVLPSTIGGDAARIWLLARDTAAWKDAIYSVLIDRIAGLVWLAVLVLVCLPWSLTLIQNPTGRATLIVIGAAGAVAPGGLFLLSHLGRTPFGQWKAARHLTDIATIAWTVLGSPRASAPIAALSVAVHLMTVLVLWFCARAIGSPFTLVNSLLLIPPVILITAVPISIGGWGVRESVMLTAFAYAGLPNSDGLLVSILFGACSFVIGAFGGIAWSLSASRVGLAAIREASDHALEI